MSAIAEEWRNVIGTSGNYLVSNLGRVRSICRGIMRGNYGTLGYHRVTIYRKGQKKSLYVHRMVAEAFIGPCPHNREVNHKDGNRSNNNVKNLQYVTHSGNMLHSFDTGINRHWGSSHVCSKLTDAALARLRSLKGKITQAEAGRIFGLSQQQAGNIWNGRTRSRGVKMPGFCIRQRPRV